MITQCVRRAALVMSVSVSAAVSLHASGTIDVRAVSSNVRYDTTESDTRNNWSSRKADYVALIKKMSPDVIGFQEVRPSQYAYLQEQLSAYAFYGRYRDNGSNSEACPVAYLKSRFDLLERGFACNGCGGWCDE